MRNLYEEGAMFWAEVIRHRRSRVKKISMPYFVPSIVNGRGVARDGV